MLASDHMKSLVTEGDTLWLQYDTSRTDRYDRPLAYVWRALPAHAQEADDPAFIARNMLNAVQVIDGYGQAKPIGPTPTTTACSPSGAPRPLPKAAV